MANFRFGTLASQQPVELRTGTRGRRGTEGSGQTVRSSQAKMILSFEFTWPVSDQTIRRYVDEMLNWRQQAEAGHSPGLRAAKAAALRFVEVARGLLSWAVEYLNLRVPPED